MILSIVVMARLLLYTGLTTAQTNIWGKNMGTGASGSISIQTLSENNSFIINSGSSSSASLLLTNYDSQGNQVWQTEKVLTESMANYKNRIMVNDSGQTITLLDYSGNIVETKQMPEVVASGLYIYYICPDDISGEYYMVGLSLSGTSEKIFVYDLDLNFLRSFTIMDNQYGWVTSCFAKNGFVYLARWRYGTGNYTNIISDVYKYDSVGTMLWTTKLLDNDFPHLSLSINDGIYCGTTNFWHNSTNSLQSWELTKLDSNNGNTVWTRNWSGSLENIQDAIWVKGILGLPNGGCLVFGQTNKNGQHDIYNPLVIGYSAQGDSLFAIEPTESSSAGEFDLGTWDNNHALILSGSIDGTSKIWKYSLPGITAVKTESSEIPVNYSLSQNYPNPFNPSTTINFSVPQSGQITLKVYNLLGCEVATLVNEELRVGNYSAKFEAKQLASGIYIYKLTAKNFTSSKKMMLMK